MSSSHSTKRVVVWVQHFADRPFLMLQWHEPLTGKRKSQSAATNNPLQAEERRAAARRLARGRGPAPHRAGESLGRGRRGG